MTELIYGIDPTMFWIGVMLLIFAGAMLIYLRYISRYTTVALYFTKDFMYTKKCKETVSYIQFKFGKKTLRFIKTCGEKVMQRLPPRRVYICREKNAGTLDIEKLSSKIASDEGLKKWLADKSSGENKNEFTKAELALVEGTEGESKATLLTEEQIGKMNSDAFKESMRFLRPMRLLDVFFVFIGGMGFDNILRAILHI